MKKTATEEQLLENLNNYEFYRDYNVPIELIEKHRNKVCWAYVSMYKKLSEQFIEKYENKVSWGDISIHQNLSEQFIEKYKDRVDWKAISRCQELSEQFREEYKELLIEDDWIH